MTETGLQHYMQLKTLVQKKKYLNASILA